MADRRNTAGNPYVNTPRKIFDKHVDRMELKRQRDRQDHRADMQALISRITNLEDQLTHLTEHVRQHCDRIRIEDDFAPEDKQEYAHKAA